MKNKTLLIVLPLCFLFLFNGKKYDEAVKERLFLPVKMCLEGEDCGTSSQAIQMASATQVEVKKVELSEGSEHVVKMLNSGDGGQMIFEPAVIKVSVGDTIHFKATDMSHNSASVQGMVPNGASAWAGSMNQDVSVTLDTEGVYVYQCDPHAMMAMIGVIQVGDAVNMNEIKQASENYRATFVMNADRIDNYLNQL
ncbi:MAG: pseudoazurin [Gammaproteobacteria bacterium]|jgi:pseudoazurin|tara:strand:+ start:2941 stop:3528 length:588 start_codon:yes stop_codon:yes gene_type:complete